jgi:hypothetical protein
MKIEFLFRKPGDHHTIHEADLPVVPREGESVIIDDNTELTVHSVAYDLRTTSARVLLK